MFSRWATSLIRICPPLRACLANGRKAVNLDQCERSIFSVAPHAGFCVMKPYLVPMISPSKYVVRVGWSSVRPATETKCHVSDIF